MASIWCWTGRHSEGGELPGGLSSVDEIGGLIGLGQAMLDVGYIELNEKGGYILPEFAKHNGSTAKGRITKAERQAVRRQSVLAEYVSAYG